MPHCIVEYSSELDGKSLLAAVHQATVASGLFHTEDIKSRAMPYDCFQLEGESGFVHTSVKMMPGRTPEQQFNLSRQIMNDLKEILGPGIAITVEIVMIDRDMYSKHITKE